MSHEAHPLSWPHGKPRTERWKREAARFEVTFARARDNIVDEVRRLCGAYPDPGLVISTNGALRRDGLPLASQRAPDDPGVAIYFVYKKRQMAFACDRWTKVEHNMQAIAKTIDALRGVARWGTGDMLQAAFTGFTALPAPGATTAADWWDVLQCRRDSSLDVIREQYRRLRSEAHPDRGGSAERFEAVEQAWRKAQEARNV